MRTQKFKLTKHISMFQYAIFAAAITSVFAGWASLRESFGRGDRFGVMAHYYPGNAMMPGATPWTLHIEADGMAVQTTFDFKKGPTCSLKKLSTSDLDDIVKAIWESDMFNLNHVYGNQRGFGFVLRVHVNGKSHAIDFDPVNMRQDDKPQFDRFMRVWKTIETKFPPPSQVK